MPEAKPYAIPKQLVWDAYQRVKANRGAAGVDGESLAAFERGVALTRNCQAALKEAQQKVEILLKKAGEPQVEEFGADEPKGG